MPTVDLAEVPLRDLNQTLHRLRGDTNETLWIVKRPAATPSLPASMFP